MNYTKKVLIELEDKLNNIARELKEIRQENEFNEIDLDENLTNINKILVVIASDTGKNIVFRYEMETKRNYDC
jgi:hypothetical protein